MQRAHLDFGKNIVLFQRAQILVLLWGLYFDSKFVELPKCFVAILRVEYFMYYFLLLLRLLIGSVLFVGCYAMQPVFVPFLFLGFSGFKSVRSPILLLNSVRTCVTSFYRFLGEAEHAIDTSEHNKASDNHDEDDNILDY